MSQIMVTGATGHLGQLVITQLLKHVPAHEIVALVRDATKATSLTAQGVSIRTGDYHQPESLSAAMEGVDRLLLISSNDFNQRLQQHKNVIDAALNAGVKHIYYTGLSIKDIHQSPLKPLLGDHFETEAYIQATGMDYTFLRNALYQEVIPMFAGAQVLDTGLFFPAGEGKTCFVSREDLAEVTAKVMTTEGHAQKVYELTGSERPDFFEIAAQIQQASGRLVQYHQPSPQAFESVLTQAGVAPAMISFSSAFAGAIAQQDFDLQTNDLETLLGRPATTVAQYLQLVYNHPGQEA